MFAPVATRYLGEGGDRRRFACPGQPAAPATPQMAAAKAPRQKPRRRRCDHVARSVRRLPGSRTGGARRASRRACALCGRGWLVPRVARASESAVGSPTLAQGSGVATGRLGGVPAGAARPGYGAEDIAIESPGQGQSSGCGSSPPNWCGSPKVIVAGSAAAAEAAARRPRRSDRRDRPQQSGRQRRLVAGLARPGGNVTGARERADALVVLGGPPRLYPKEPDRRSRASHKLPAIYYEREFAAAAAD